MKLNKTFKFLNKSKFISLNKNPQKNFSYKILSPNSLLFTHKKNMDRTHKLMTYMKPPQNLKEIHMRDENDFEPGLGYFSSENFSLKLFEYETKQNTPDEGFVQVTIPFDTVPKLQNDYRLLYTNRMRNGKLIELLDYLSALSAYRYSDVLPKSKKATFVTASVDNIELYKDVNVNNPLVINAYPSWIGQSSMEIRMDLFSDRNITEQSFLGSAFFMYVMREGDDYKKKKTINPLNTDKIHDEIEREKSKIRFEIGSQNKKIRIQASENSLNKKAPNQGESEILHNLFIEVKKNKDAKKFKSIKETKIVKNVLMHSQNMNVNGHVFGGYIMKEALDAAYICAYMHSNQEPPIVFAIDNVTFYKPVIIGSVAKFVANVCFVHEELIHVSVEVHNYIDKNPVLTTMINVTYLTNSRTEDVYPTSYECGVKYLESKRRLEGLFSYI